MDISFIDKRLEGIYSKVLNGSRLSKEDGIYIYETHDLIGLGQIANHVRRSLHANKAFYIYNQHLNYTNVCKNRCRFCAYARDRKEKGAYTWSIDEIEKRLLERIDEPVNELHIVGGLNEALTFDYFIALLKTVKKCGPKPRLKPLPVWKLIIFPNLPNFPLNRPFKSSNKPVLK